MESLWGEDFKIDESVEKSKKIIKKIKEPKAIKVIERKALSKTIPFDERLAIIKEKVYKILGSQQDKIVCIKDIKSLHEYINKAIENKIISIDTETNNSLDPITCKLMGPCIYTPGEKQAYIPINHRDYKTGERLNYQLTELDIKQEFQRLIDAKTFIIMHNGKFDYQVLKCTCNLILPINWDTLIGAKLLNENERSAGLKQQYIDKIDPNQDKYSIDELFENEQYADIPPDLFAFYAAHDSGMTYELYEWQIKQFNKSDNAKLLKLAQALEMPLVHVIAEMELAGMDVDQQYATLLSKKFHNRLDNIDAKIFTELDTLKDKIIAWRQSPEANIHPPKKSGEGLGKSKSEQLADPINLGSPTQLAILFYDVLQCPQVNTKSPRGTGEAELEAIAEKLNLNICKLLLARRECVKLLSTYIDVIPELAKRWPDGRVRTHFQQYGAATGRLSSSDPINFQNIPSHEKSIRMIFNASQKEEIIEPENDTYVVANWTEVQTVNGFKYSKDLTISDILMVDENNHLPIKNISHVDNNVIIKV